MRSSFRECWNGLLPLTLWSYTPRTYVLWPASLKDLPTTALMFSKAGFPPARLAVETSKRLEMASKGLAAITHALPGEPRR